MGEVADIGMGVGSATKNGLLVQNLDLRRYSTSKNLSIKSEHRCQNSCPG